MSMRVASVAAAALYALCGCAALAGPRRHAQRPSTIAAAHVDTPSGPPRVTAAANEAPSPEAANDAKAAAPNDAATAPPLDAPNDAPSMVPAVAIDPNATPASATPALEYAALSSSSCFAELKKRAIPFTRVEEAIGVDAPIRLAGPLHGVDFHGQEPKSKQATTVYEILDCRLALSLDDFARVLAQHDVVEAVHMSIYRPAAKTPKDPKRHEAALAIDLGHLVKKDGTKLAVLDHWHGYIGAKTCGPGAGPSPATKEAIELRRILCDAYDAKLFNVVLTPNYNKPHQNHFHLEVTRGVKWFILD